MFIKEAALAISRAASINMIDINEMRSMIWHCCMVGLAAATSMGYAQNAIPTIDTPKTYKLVWADEFNNNGSPDTTNWKFEQGFVRNNELQWYQSQNAWCSNGLLIIEARKEHLPNPNYNAQRIPHI
ncbi:hypothetical protein [Mucilaginibacter sp. OK268]|jgi:beta-glucanase (GH16 family)|uniref:glycoside hydrolase family 16 protein n=1 Tax=Mucilaginibacter sp. OK268 TaxID=1881048 RepID=UPI001C4094DF|nr:hypothetical protein [Mucilaginibacter sp. OK268]